ncbi:MAG: hypothetical protein GX639_11615 [Fibrobacter sp.]|nr:hypothetical protein [Fibrobacter sp.]
MARAEKFGQTDRLEGGSMVKSLTVQCPHCHQVSDIYLSTNACVIVLNCPTCMSPIMYFENKIFLLTDKQVSAIKDTTHNAAIMRMLDRIAHPEVPVEKTAEKASMKATAHTTNSSQSLSEVSGGEPVHDIRSRSSRDRNISPDDITNLRIELALCNDSQAFIDRL